MKLGEKQRTFAKLLPRLIDKAHELGFAVTLGDGYRDPRAFGEMGKSGPYGNDYSAHKLRLAVDLNLYTWNENTERWDYCMTTEAHRPLGEWWERQDDLCCWGGRFNDGNHYSLTHQGVK